MRKHVYQFNSPPSWPVPPQWRPPVGWQPDPGWPPAPAGWGFWTNRRGGRSNGPIGAYGATGAGRLEVATSDPGLLLMHG